MKLSRSMTTAIAATGALALITACGSSDATTSENGAEEVVVYTADGLNDGDSSFYQQVAQEFEAETGISVTHVEAGSGEILQRVRQETGNPQADVLVTLPPFIQDAHSSDLLQPYVPEGAEHVPDDRKSDDDTYYTLVDNYLAMIYNTDRLEEPPSTLEDLLDDSLQDALQYSTPGVAGDGTAFMLFAHEVLGDAADEYLSDLQVNNVGPSSSTGQLAAQVDRGELLVANGDVQMNYAQSASMPNLGIFFLENAEGQPATLSLPYVAGLLDNAPHQEAAEQYMDFLYSEAGQELVTTAGNGYPARDDITPSGETAEELAEIVEGVEVIYLDWEAIAEQLDDLLNDYNATTGTL